MTVLATLKYGRHTYQRKRYPGMDPPIPERWVVDANRPVNPEEAAMLDEIVRLMAMAQAARNVAAALLDIAGSGQ